MFHIRNVLGMIVVTAATASGGSDTMPEERQITFSCKNHELDNNDNFSPDGRFLCYDTRETVGPGIENSQSIELVEIETGREIVIYQPPASVTGAQAAPGVGAASYSWTEPRVAFIHGPLLEEVPARGYYGKPNRNGAVVQADGPPTLQDGRYPMAWLDLRDAATNRDTIPGAHRGGTHRHEYSRDGRRIGFTYDDFLLPRYDRTIGYMERHPNAPAPAECWFAVLVAPAPMDQAKPGEIEKAYGDSWVDAQGTMRAFIGKVRNADGVTYEESLFVADIPVDVDITTADAGSAARYPRPPQGVSVRRLTHAWAGGVVRGAPDGTRIAYYGKAADGSKQVFIIPADGSDHAEDPAKRPVQATSLPHGTESGLRWHPSGETIFCVSNNGIAATCVMPGPRFGQSVFLTSQGDTPPRYALVVSPDGRRLAYNKAVAAKDADGKLCTNYAGADFSQIFLLDIGETTWLPDKP